MPSRDLADLDPKLAGIAKKLKTAYELSHSGKSFIITCTYRSPQEQAELYTHGRTKPGPVLTNCDGFTNPSKHNEKPARAFDVAMTVGGKVTWDDAAYDELGAMAPAYGLRWGGTFQHFKDRPHFELP